MTPDQAKAWNAAIDAAVKKYKNGIGAIKALKIQHVVTAEHISTTTKQKVVEVE